MKGWLFALLAVLSGGCSGNSGASNTGATSLLSSAPACEPAEAGTCPATPPSFVNDVLPILNRDCNATCHAPNMGQWPLVSFGDVADWAPLINADVKNCVMPPADAGVFSDGDRNTVLDWIACGTPNN